MIPAITRNQVEVKIDLTVSAECNSSLRSTDSAATRSTVARSCPA